MANKREIPTFSISFLDCICCGFGAILLLFVLTSGKKSEYRNEQLSDTEIDLGMLQRNIQTEEKDLLKLSKTLEEIRNRLRAVSNQEEETAREETDKKTELSLLLKQLSEMEKLRDTLLGEMENLPTVPEETPIPFPNKIRRQYLTDFKLDGERVLFLIEASGGMLDVNADLAIERITQSEEEKRAAPKWQHTLKAVKWLLTALKPPSQYQIYFFNDETQSIYPTRTFEWLDMSDRKTTAETLHRLDEITPHGNANLEKAFFVIGNMKPMPDNIIIFTDGLPTQGESVKAGPIKDETIRIRMFNAAKRQMPRGVPINIILFPWAGDPAAAALYWVLASDTRGSFICPAKTWPET